MFGRHWSALNRMQKVDIALGVLGAVALLATGLGIAFYDDINGLEHYHVDMVETPLNQDAETVPSGGLTWMYDVPDNAYHLAGGIALSWSADNPTLSGDVDVTVVITPPVGDATTLTQTFDFGDNEGTVVIDMAKWAEPPAEFTGGADDVEDTRITWDEQLTIEITISGPQGQLPGVEQDDASYTAELDGAKWHGFAVVPATPEVETA